MSLRFSSPAGRWYIGLTAGAGMQETEAHRCKMRIVAIQIFGEGCQWANRTM